MVVRIVEDLVRFNSSFPHEITISEHVSRILQTLGFGVQKQIVEGRRANIIAKKGSGPALLLFGHLDTVSAVKGWITNPFQLVRKGDKLYGLGTWDMKGGLAAILSAVKGFDPRGFTLKLAFVVDEEIYSLGMERLIRSNWLRDVFGAVCPEPGFIYGIRGIALGRIGRSVYRVAVKTSGGHVYRLDSQSNAIMESFKVIRILRQLKKVRHSQLGDFVIFPRFIRGGESSMSIPKEVELELETQLVPPQTTDSVLEELKSVFAHEKIKAELHIAPVERPTPFCQPFVTSVKDPFITKITNTLKHVIKEKPTYYYRRSVADENRIAMLGIPVVTVGPGGGNAHEANEWVSATELNTLTEFLKRLLSTYNKV